METKQTGHTVAYHRNGIAGVGFYVGIVQCDGRNMLIVRFPDIDKQAGGAVCAAFDLALLDKREIAFGVNSWRGDDYADVIDPLIAEHEATT